LLKVTGRRITLQPRRLCACIDIYRIGHIKFWFELQGIYISHLEIHIFTGLVTSLRRNCILKQVIEGKVKGEIEVTRRRKKLLDELKDRRGYSHFKEEALDRTMEKPFWKRRWTCRQTDY
jgi:hypothetical protein